MKNKRSLSFRIPHFLLVNGNTTEKDMKDRVRGREKKKKRKDEITCTISWTQSFPRPFPPDAVCEESFFTVFKLRWKHHVLPLALIRLPSNSRTILCTLWQVFTPWKMKEKLMLPLSKIVVEIYVKFPLVSTIFFFQSLNYFTHRGNCD